MREQIRQPGGDPPEVRQVVRARHGQAGSPNRRHVDLGLRRLELLGGGQLHLEGVPLHPAYRLAGRLVGLRTEPGLDQRFLAPAERFQFGGGLMSGKGGADQRESAGRLRPL
ncbi:hypothetical protein [Streptomyces sp. NPDC059092]|uniref:hypothetical protein n=1 Tax=Streptomyces sp. NPDC059092 TaxID=3346725 RepID=UPI0036954FB4